MDEQNQGNESTQEPSAADLDAVAGEQQAAEQTAGAEQTVEELQAQLLTDEGKLAVAEAIAVTGKALAEAAEKAVAEEAEKAAREEAARTPNEKVREVTGQPGPAVPASTELSPNQKVRQA